LPNVDERRMTIDIQQSAISILRLSYYRTSTTRHGSPSVILERLGTVRPIDCA